MPQNKPPFPIKIEARFHGPDITVVGKDVRGFLYAQAMKDEARRQQIELARQEVSK